MLGLPYEIKSDNSVMLVRCDCKDELTTIDSTCMFVLTTCKYKNGTTRATLIVEIMRKSNIIMLSLSDHSHGQRFPPY